jgi:hypothetical protein
LLKKAIACFDKLSMSGNSLLVSGPSPLVLSPSKDERRVFQQPAREPSPQVIHTRKQRNISARSCWAENWKNRAFSDVENQNRGCALEELAILRSAAANICKCANDLGTHAGQ